MKMQQMAKRYDYGNEKRDASDSDDEEEALSLCDLPIILVTNKDPQSRNSEEANESSGLEEEEDFNFSSLDISHSAEQMCVADDVFFKGQILPLRLSVSSDTGSARFQQSSLHPSRSNSGFTGNSSRSSSTNSPSIGFTGNSSRSSSTNSHNSGSSSIRTISCNTPLKRARSKSIIRNQFRAHPSPTPQIKMSCTRHRKAGSRSRKSSSTWDLFRVGLVRTSEIELHDLKARTNSTNNKHIKKSFGSRNSSSGSSSISNEGKASQPLISIKKDEKKRRFFDIDGKGLFSGCKCSADVIETAPSKIVIMKTNSAAISSNNYEMETQALKEKLQIMKQQKQRQEIKHHQQQDGTEALPHHRTSEWLRELSISGGHGGV